MLTDEDLAHIFVLLSDHLEYLNVCNKEPDTSLDDKISIVRDLNTYIPIYEKINKFYKDNDITIKVKDYDVDYLNSLDIDTNL